MINFATTARAGLAAAALFAGAAIASPASAFNINGITLDAGVQSLVIGNVFENRVLNLGDTISGYGRVSSIENNNNSAITWASGQNGVELTYAFSGFKLQAFIPGVGNGTFLFSGGTANFYTDAAQNFASNNSATATDGNLWLSLAAGGVTTCGALGVACVDGPNTIITLNGTANSTTLGGITAGSGASLFAVTGGPAQGNFDTNTFSGFDIDAGFTFSTALAGASGQDFGGSLRAGALAIPEPATLGMLGMGLIGLGALTRRRRAA